MTAGSDASRINSKSTYMNDFNIKHRRIKWAEQ
jgi:hypothetical protein